MKTLGKFILLLVFRLESVLVCALVSSFLNKILLELEKRFDLLFSALLWLFSLSSIARLSKVYCIPGRRIAEAEIYLLAAKVINK